MTEGFSDRVPDAIGTAFGLRAFEVNHAGQLNSLYRRFMWGCDVNVADCTPSQFLTAIKYRERRDVGHDGWRTCSCGFYAYSSLENAPECGYEHSSCEGEECMSARHRRVSGVIEVWGHLIVGSKGFRAEKARIRALIISDPKFFGVSRTYPNVPVFPTIPEALAEFPLTQFGEAA